MSEKIDLSQLSPFDRKLGEFLGLNDCVRSGESVIREVPTLGLGGTDTYIVQTVRQKDVGDWVFVERMSETGPVRLVLPPKVATTIARQRDQVATQNRKKASRAVMEERIQAGYRPTFSKRRKAP